MDKMELYSEIFSIDAQDISEPWHPVLYDKKKVVSMIGISNYSDFPIEFEIRITGFPSRDDDRQIVIPQDMVLMDYTLQSSPISEILIRNPMVGEINKGSVIVTLFYRK